jgi:glucose/mannose-6-phosphate isomerase
VDLDSPDGFAGVDRAGALSDVEQTARQWEQAAAVAPATLDPARFDTIVICGMGGSGITGDIVWALGLDTYPRPIVVHKGYGVPAFTGPRTLVVALSHSGETEETLSAFAAAGERGATRLAVTSGGQLAQRATADGATLVLVPGGPRPPRHSLGTMLVPTLAALGMDGGLGEAIDVLDSAALELGRDVPTARNAAKRLALRLATGVLPLVWGGHGIGSVAAYRLKCQLSENAKVTAIHGELPEANHNDVVGWEGGSVLAGAAALVAMRDPAGEHPRVARRFELTVDLLGDRLAWTDEITAVGTSTLARVASLLFQADMVSLYTALATDIDPTPITSIDRLKRGLSAAEVAP